MIKPGNRERIIRLLTRAGGFFSEEKTMDNDLIRENSEKNVAGYLGTDTTSVYRYIRGDVLPSTDRLLMLSTLLGVTINDLLAVA